MSSRESPGHNQGIEEIGHVYQCGKKKMRSTLRMRLSTWLEQLRPMDSTTRYVTPPGMLRSAICSQEQIESSEFRQWQSLLREHEGHLHRKSWEYCFIAQALAERDVLGPGRTGLGFAVGQEPLTAYFASVGTDILATDLSIEHATVGGWVTTNQHASSLKHLNVRNICPDEAFEKRVRFRHVDMRSLPKDLGLYDFVWSACSLEHLGSIALGERFITQSLEFVKPGGVAVHTTEYNVASNSETIKVGSSVIFRERDIRRIAHRLEKAGYGIDVDYSLGHQWADVQVEAPPFTHEVHIRLVLDGFIATSIGLIITKPPLR